MDGKLIFDQNRHRREVEEIKSLRMFVHFNHVNTYTASVHFAMYSVCKK